MFLSASLVTGTTALPVRVRNLSSRGALLDGALFPPVGTMVGLIRGELSANGLIAWHSNGHAGISFTVDIHVDAWVKRAGHAGQQRVDEALAALRREQSAPAAAHAPEGPTLGELSDQLHAICERIACMPSLSLELGEELVRLDTLAGALQRFAAKG